VYLTDVFDNLTPLLIGNFAEPIPLVPRPTPPVIPPRVDVQRKDALVYMVDVTKGGGLAGYPAGAVKALRIGAHEYRFGGNGDTYSASYEGGWDIKRILGTVPVEADGSAYFRVPANTPIFVQPLDADGRALQTMRSWFTAMPGEVLSCVGCHERQSQTPPMGQSMASAKPPAEIAPWFGPTRGFSFDHEVQLVLDHRCAGCHDGGKGDTKPDFRARSLHVGYKGNYSPAYLALAKYVRRPGYEADYHLAAPSEWKADTSPVVQLLLKGHHNVKLSRQEWDRLYTWMDFNVPYSGNWRETHQPPADEQVVRRAKYKQLYAGLNDVDEAVSAAPAVGKFEPPAPETADEGPGSPRMKLPGWPQSADQAAAAQKAAGLGDRVLDLGRGAAMPLVAIPAGRFVMGDPNGPPDERRQCVVAIDQPFYMAKFEVSNRQYSLFDPTHDSAYMDARGKDRYTRGYPVNDPNQPVIRISWHQAMAFCRWLSARSGLDCTLPTEAEWEYACRAGSASAWPFGDRLEGLSAVANIADSSLGGWAFGRVSPGYNDGAMFTAPPGRYKPNAWGLHDMIGNVAEWTRSDYRPYPYVDTDGRNNPPNMTDSAPIGKVVRGGSWYTTFPQARSASRWGYPPHQPVFDVGLRVIARPLKVAQR
jgi:formylglycine-generating enzyme required for sulfatase activity